MRTCQGVGGRRCGDGVEGEEEELGKEKFSP
jgi:hypothetical protein